MGVVALLLAFVACADDIAEVHSNELKQIVMTASDFEMENGSRTNFQITNAGVEVSWAANDTVGIFPNVGAQAYFPMTSGAGTKTAIFDGGGWSLKEASTYAAYYPFISDIYLNKHAIPVDYTGQVQTGNASTAHLGAYDYMAATASNPKNDNVTFAFKHLGALIQMKLTLPQVTTLKSVTLTAGGGTFSVKGKVDVMADTLGIESETSAKELTLKLKGVATTEANQIVTLYLMLPPTDLSGKTLKAVLGTDKGNVEIDLESKNFKAGTAYVLSGTMETENLTGGSYKDGVVSLAEAGTMRNLLGEDYLNITSLKVVGPINGDDIGFLRNRLGASSSSQGNWSKLTTLDLSKATIVEGGDCYFSSWNEFYTSNDVIGDYMFNGCDMLQSIILPSDVTSIGDYAFSGCSWLNPIDIPDGVTSIGYSAFEDCISLTSIDIPDAVASIGEYAFVGCSSLTSVTIGAGVTSIGDASFHGCKRLTSVTMGAGVTSIGVNAFVGCSSLKDFYCYATTPPHLNAYSFSEYMTEKNTLYVPERCGTKYKSSNWAKYFKTIKEM